jgi:hypothetical protein
MVWKLNSRTILTAAALARDRYAVATFNRFIRPSNIQWHAIQVFASLGNLTDTVSVDTTV